MELTQLVEAMEKVSASLRVPMDLDEVLEQITFSAIDTISVIDHASISLTGTDGRIHTLAATDPLVIRAEELQYVLGEGPCLVAELSELIVQVEDLADDLRWPEYGREVATTLGLRSMLVFQFRAEPQVRGALNLYSYQPHSIDVEARQLGALFAGLAAIALGRGREEASLSAGLDTLKTIGQATGIVMERYRLDPDRAFAVLVHISRSSDAKLREVAAGLVTDAACTAMKPNGSESTPTAPVCLHP